jgi:Fe-S-cluster-containing hydrogenase component 2
MLFLYKNGMAWRLQISVQQYRPSSSGETAMAYKIVASQCTACAACEPVCPNKAIYEKSGLFAIKADKCTECIGHFDDAQCVIDCPADCIVIDKSVPRYAAA